MPRELALAALHRADGAVIEEVGGWLLPVQYSDPAAEHRAVRAEVGVADRSLVGKATVTGRDRAAFLHGMLTNDIKALSASQGCGAAFLDAHGKVMSLLWVYALEDRLLLELPPSTTEKTLQGLDRFLISEKAYFEPADDAFVVIAVEGPGATALLSRLAGRALDLAPFAHEEVVVAGAPVRVIRRTETGLGGLHCWTAAEHGPALWRALRDSGAPPVGTRALEVLRVEAGIPRYGADVDETVLMPETRLEQLIHYSKGCYIGQEVVARVKYRGHVNRALTGLTLDGDRVPAAGAAVVVDGTEVGRVTSAVLSFSLGVPIALGYVRREHLEPGAAVAVRDGEALIPARVTELPFVKAA